MTSDELYAMMDNLGIEKLKSNMRGTEVGGCCPLCPDSRPSFSVSVQKLLFNCYSCLAKGSILILVARVKNCTPEEAKKYIDKYGDCDLENVSHSFLSLLGTSGARQLVKPLVPTSHFAPYTTSSLRARAQKYLTKRGVLYRKDGTLLTGLRVGFEPTQRRVMFPWFTLSNEFLGCTGRLSYKPDESIKDARSVRYMPFFGLQKGQHLFFGCSYKLRMSNEVITYVIVEGEIDAIRVSQTYKETGCVGIAIGKSFPTKEQIRLLLQLGGPVLIGTDNDDTGLKGREMLISALDGKVIFSNVHWPYKDAGDCTDAEIKKILKSPMGIFSF